MYMGQMRSPYELEKQEVQWLIYIRRTEPGLYITRRSNRLTWCKYSIHFIQS